MLFQVALALIEIYSPALLATSDEIDTFVVLQSLAPLTFDSSRLVSAATNNFQGSVTDRAVTALREQYRRQLQEEAAGGGRAAAGAGSGQGEGQGQQEGLGGKGVSMMKKLFQKLERGAAEVSNLVRDVREGDRSSTPPLQQPLSGESPAPSSPPLAKLAPMPKPGSSSNVDSLQGAAVGAGALGSGAGTGAAAGAGVGAGAAASAPATPDHRVVSDLIDLSSPPHASGPAPGAAVTDLSGNEAGPGAGAAAGAGAGAEDSTAAAGGEAATAGGSDGSVPAAAAAGVGAAAGSIAAAAPPVDPAAMVRVGREGVHALGEGGGADCTDLAVY